MPNFDQNQFRVYVQKMPGNATDYQLKDHFSKFGEVTPPLQACVVRGPRLAGGCQLFAPPWPRGFVCVWHPARRRERTAVGKRGRDEEGPRDTVKKGLLRPARIPGAGAGIAVGTARGLLDAVARWRMA